MLNQQMASESTGDWGQCLYFEHSKVFEGIGTIFRENTGSRGEKVNKRRLHSSKRIGQFCAGISKVVKAVLSGLPLVLCNRVLILCSYSNAKPSHFADNDG